MTAARQFGGKDMIVAMLGVSLGLAYAAAYDPLLAIVAMVCVIFATWVLARPDLVLYVVVAAMPWNGMLEFPSPTLSLNKILGLALAVSWLLWAVRKDAPLKFPRSSSSPRSSASSSASRCSSRTTPPAV